MSIHRNVHHGISDYTECWETSGLTLGYGYIFSVLCRTIKLETEAKGKISNTDPVFIYISFLVLFIMDCTFKKLCIKILTVFPEIFGTLILCPRPVSHSPNPSLIPV